MTRKSVTVLSFLSRVLFLWLLCMNNMKQSSLVVEAKGQEDAPPEVISVEVSSAIVCGQSVRFGETLKEKKKLLSAKGDVFTVQFSVIDGKTQEGVQPHQAVVHFAHVASGTSIYRVMSQKSKENKLSLELALQDAANLFDYQSGEYAIRVYLGDARFKTSLDWDLGYVHFSLAAALPKTPAPLYSQPLLHESDTTLKALPEISHVMRPAESRPMLIVSILFTSLAVTPMLGFFFYLHKLGMKRRSLPFTTLKPVWSITF